MLGLCEASPSLSNEDLLWPLVRQLKEVLLGRRRGRYPAPLADVQKMRVASVAHCTFCIIWESFAISCEDVLRGRWHRARGGLVSWINLERRLIDGEVSAMFEEMIGELKEVREMDGDGVEEVGEVLKEK